MPTESAPPEPDLLFGDNHEERIVGVDVDTASRSPTITLYTRSSDDRVAARTEPVYPFAFFSGLDAIGGLPRHSYWQQELAGDLEYRHLLVFRDQPSYAAAIGGAAAFKDTAWPPLFRIPSLSQQYLLQSGRTLFKGMNYDDLHRLQLDIEVISESGFPNSRRRSDEIVIIAMADNRGWSDVLHSRDSGEADLLRRMIDTLNEKDPDVIEGHNIFRFDLPYIRRRCALHGVPLTIGRGGTAPRVFETSMRFAERSFEFTCFEIGGRHVVDTFLLLMAYDVTARALPGYGLKESARHFGFAAPDRTYVPGDEITDVWRTNPDRLLRYALDDVKETAALAHLLSGAGFYLTQMTPLTFQDVARTGPGVKIESLMVRAYLRERHSLPAPRAVGEVSGAYTDLLYTGVAAPVAYADVESLYPSIMLTHDVQPAVDRLGIFPRLLKHLTQLRLETKTAMRAATDQRERLELDARQNSFKILINSFYGYLGFAQALFNDTSEADRVTRIGREILRTVISMIKARGGTVIEVDTDGVFFVPPGQSTSENTELGLITEMNAELPPGITVALAGRYAKMLSYKMKNYALLGYDGKLTFKGSSLISRANERFGRRFVRRCVRMLLDGDVQAMHDEFLATRRRIRQHEWESVEDFCRTETVKDRLRDYEADLAAGRRQPSAALEVARELARRGRPIRKGDRVSYYIAGPAGKRLYEAAKPAEDWRRGNPDENTQYYLRRLDELTQRFAPFFRPSDHRAVFAEEDLFGFSAEGISVVSGQAVHDPAEESA